MLLGIRKAIGKMGHTIKNRAGYAYYAAKEKVQEAEIKVREQQDNPKSAYNKSKRVVNRGLNYAERVRDNTNHSPFLGHSEHKRKHKKRSHAHQTINVYVQGGGPKRKRKQKRGFSLI